MARKLCNICNTRKVTTANGPSFKDMCDPCYEEGGWENTHSDGNHDDIAAGTLKFEETTFKTKEAFNTWLAEEREGCWICYPELNLAQKPAKAAGAKKVQGFRRTQLNHKDMCTHAQTPKARRTCKEAFWAGVKVIQQAQGLTEDQAWEQAIAHMSKPAAKVGGWAGVAPLGPKGGAGASLKAAGAKAKALTGQAKLAKAAGLIK